MERMRLEETEGAFAEQRAHAADRFEIAGDFMRVAQLAKALGISANSIRAQIRRGVFPIPHRHLGDIVVVKLDDYVEWLGAKPKPKKAMRAEEVPERCSEPAPSTVQRPSTTSLAETPKQVAERMKREVLAAMAARAAKH